MGFDLRFTIVSPTVPGQPVQLVAGSESLVVRVWRPLRGLWCAAIVCRPNGVRHITGLHELVLLAGAGCNGYCVAVWRGGAAAGADRVFVHCAGWGVVLDDG